MGDSCERCGRPKGISFNDIDAYKKCLGGAPCLERAYERSQASLAAARREITDLRESLTAIYRRPDHAVAYARAALAAPAAGEEGKRDPIPEPRCTCHARKTGKHAQSCELWNTTGDL